MPRQYNINVRIPCLRRISPIKHNHSNVHSWHAFLLIAKAWIDKAYIIRNRIFPLQRAQRTSVSDSQKRYQCASTTECCTAIDKYCWVGASYSCIALAQLSLGAHPVYFIHAETEQNNTRAVQSRLHAQICTQSVLVYLVGSISQPQWKTADRDHVTKAGLLPERNVGSEPATEGRDVLLRTLIMPRLPVSTNKWVHVDNVVASGSALSYWRLFSGPSGRVHLHTRTPKIHAPTQHSQITQIHELTN